MVDLLTGDVSSFASARSYRSVSLDVHLTVVYMRDNNEASLWCASDILSERIASVQCAVMTANFEMFGTVSILR